MRIFKRGEIYWCQFRGKRVSLRTTDRKAAELAFKELQRATADPTYRRARSVTLEVATIAWLDSLPLQDKPPREGTLEMYGYHCGHFGRIFGLDLPLAELDAEAVDSYIAKRRSEPVPGKRPDRAKVKSHTITKEIGTLRQILTFAARKGWLHRPLEAILPASNATGYEPLNRSLTECQVPQLLRALSQERRAICAFVIGLAADKCAISRARLEDFEKGSVLIRGTKNSRRWARVPIVAPFGLYVRLARMWLSKFGSFPERRNWTRELERACLATGLPRITLRDLRRSHGKILRARGVAPHLIGAMLRHSDGRMAERVYGRLEAEDLGRLVQAK